MSLKIVLPNKMVISKIEGELPGIEVGTVISDIVKSNSEQATIYLKNIKDDQEEKKMKEIKKMKCKGCSWHRIYGNESYCIIKLPVKKVNLNHDCAYGYYEDQFFNDEKTSNGCAYGNLKPTNSMKFIELFGNERYISLLQHLKPGDQNVDILLWFEEEYKELPCED